MDLRDRPADQSWANIQRSPERDPEDLEHHLSLHARLLWLVDPRSCYTREGVMVSARNFTSKAYFKETEEKFLVFDCYS